jgi:hypothetical protein
MNVIDLTQQRLDILPALELAHNDPLILIAPDGREYVLAEADDFDHEVELLRSSTAFQEFLDERLAAKHHRRPLTDVLRDIEAEIASEQAANKE